MGKLRSFPGGICFVVMICAMWSASLFSLCECEKGFDSLLRLRRPAKLKHRGRKGPVPTRVFSVDDFGAKGDGLSDDTQAFEDAWNVACSSPSVSEILIPSRLFYLVRPIDFAGPCQSKVTLKISGAIVAPKEPDMWRGKNPMKWLYFHGVKHLTVEGHGKINGMGQKWWARSCKINKTNPCHHAPRALTFHRCRHLKVRNLMIENSQQMHLAFTNCVKVVASNLKVIAPAISPNTDGIHISTSSYVEVKNSIVGTGDDCISIVGNSSGIKIRDITCGPGHGISIGSLGKSKSWAYVQDILVDGVRITNTENGVRIKTWQGGSGIVRKVTFQNVFMENVSNPILIDQFYCDSRFHCQNQSSAVKVENISYVNIKGTSASEEAIRFACSDVFKCDSLYLENIQLVSSFGGRVRSFCWEARGLTVGYVVPPSCFTCADNRIIEQVPSESSLQAL